MLLTIGMAHCNDFDGAYFSIQDIRKELKYSGMESLLNEKNSFSLLAVSIATSGYSGLMECRALQLLATR